MANAPDPTTDSRVNIADPAPEPLRMQVSSGVAALRSKPEPDAVMTSQALHGETVYLHREDGEFGFVQCARDHYTGWALMASLSAPADAPTHRVSVLRTYAFSQADLKTAPHYMLSLGAEIVAAGEDGGYLKDVRGGWITKKHLAPIDDVETDPAGIAEQFVGSPYLWGGRESLGLDCSGLTVAAYGACGVLLPRDSDMQLAWSGERIEDWDRPGALERGDLVFWKGHVGIMTSDKDVIHANAITWPQPKSHLPAQSRALQSITANPEGLAASTYPKGVRAQHGWGLKLIRSKRFGTAGQRAQREQHQLPRCRWRLPVR